MFQAMYSRRHLAQVCCQLNTVCAESYGSHSTDGFTITITSTCSIPSWVMTAELDATMSLVHV